ncbi:hypothetical protein [Arboricoccus pini]|uniref:hypothetical protein n=1 Tax=Arboricoccus pini TaxID=1963835 RepID=UPI00105417DF|nr:hypothetical protein [Arboricoccus pini]
MAHLDDVSASSGTASQIRATVPGATMRSRVSLLLRPTPRRIKMERSLLSILPPDTTSPGRRPLKHPGSAVTAVRPAALRRLSSRSRELQDRRLDVRLQHRDDVIDQIANDLFIVNVPRVLTAVPLAIVGRAGARRGGVKQVPDRGIKISLDSNV